MDGGEAGECWLRVGEGGGVVTGGSFSFRVSCFVFCVFVFCLFVFCVCCVLCVLSLVFCLIFIVNCLSLFF